MAAVLLVLTPWHILAIASLLLILTYVVDRGVTSRRRRRLRKLAAELRMRYSDIDRFRIAPRLALTLPISGAADVRVRDLMYRLADDGTTGAYLYVFTIEYAIGTIGGVSRRRVVGCVAEPAGRSCERFDRIDLADQTQPLADQYRAMVAAHPEPAPALESTTATGAGVAGSAS